MEESIVQEFSRKIGHLTSGKAYLKYCEEVYGYRMHLFNMMDKEQLDYVFNSIPLTEEDVILDLGCGTGSILKKLVEQTGCTGFGIDFLDNSMIQEEHPNVKFICEDIDNLADIDVKPTVTLLVDSIYFSTDITKLIQILSQMPNNRVYMFFSQYAFDEQGNGVDAVAGDKTDVAQILDKLGVKYEFIDYSRNEKEFYSHSIKVLKSLEDDFKAEELENTYREKLGEQLLGKRFYDAEIASRFLYIF